MDRQGRIYRRTDSGLKAWVTHDPAVSDDERRILGLIHGDMHGDVVRTLLRRHADYRRLAELEARGLIASEAAAPERDLDFTGSFVFSSS